MGTNYTKGEMRHHLADINSNITTSGRLIQGLFNELGVDIGLTPTPLLNKPIGIGSKCYAFMESMLTRNIGSHQFAFDGFGTPIGMLGNPYLNSTVSPWFLLDEERKKYSDYLSYVNKMYFHGTMMPPNFQNHTENMAIFDYNDLMERNARVGVIHSYNLDTVLGARLLIPNGTTNPNGYEDTRLGVINNFYLSAALYNSLEKDFQNKDAFAVTKNGYVNFGLKGRLGIQNNTFEYRNGKVMSQDEVTDNVIPYSSLYNDIESLSEFYSIKHSLGLIEASGDKTKEFISKSMLGIDLMSDVIVPSIGEEDYNADVLKRFSKKKYFPTKGSRGANYLDMMTSINVSYETTSDEEKIRLVLNDAGNDNLSVYNTFLTYAEAEKNGRSPQMDSKNANSGIAIGRYEVYDSNNIKNKEDIIAYTNKQFKANKFKTLIARFHTDEFDNEMDSKVMRDNTSSAISQYGMSHGRNLLKKNHKDNNVNGYSDPYCRVWTYHKQYAKYSDLIRPFDGDKEAELTKVLRETMQPNRLLLKDYGVKNEYGILDFKPRMNEDVLTRCMFSIENLAWKGEALLSQYHRGPEGGRIMWFPPYGLAFNENVNTEWSSTQFIGRGEKIYSYVDTERSGNLSFQILIDHPSLLKLLHNVTDTTGDVDDVESYEQQILRFFAGCDILNKQESSDNVNSNVPQNDNMNNIPLDRGGVIENPNNNNDTYTIDKGVVQFDNISFSQIKKVIDDYKNHKVEPIEHAAKKELEHIKEYEYKLSQLEKQEKIKLLF